MNKELSIIRPGGDLIHLERGGTCRVYPVGFKHLQQFANQLTKILAEVLGSLKVDRDTIKDQALIEKITQEQLTDVLMSQALPVLLTEGLELVRDCTAFFDDEEGKEPSDFRIDDLEHWEVPAILESWIDQSFGEKRKWTPWVQMIQRVTGRFLKKKTAKS